ncbi:MAG: phage gp6-like head-tail connector protein, partial [Brevundimonas sp.]|nr:phage gp6-like head-tail connector protein [Brevundimonas sp.]
MTAPVSLTEAKLFLRVEHGAEDGLIQTLIDAARSRVE